jgi:hypothetical protein
MVKQKRGQISNIKTYFIIVNLIISLVAFSWMVSAGGTGDDTKCSKANCPGGNCVNNVCKPKEDTSKKEISKAPEPVQQQQTPEQKPDTTSQLTSVVSLGSGLLTVKSALDGSTKSGTFKFYDKTYRLTGEEADKLTELTAGVKEVEGTDVANTKIKEFLKDKTPEPLGFWDTFGGQMLAGLGYAALVAGFAYLVFDNVGPEGSNAGVAAAWAAGSGFMAYSFLTSSTVKTALAGKSYAAWATTGWGAAGVGLTVATIIFMSIYENKKRDSATFEFSCLPWQAPVGGKDCEKCNSLSSCNEYVCKSLGQACEIINPGTTEEKCIWKNPKDVNSPVITMVNVSKEHSMKVSSAGVEIIGPKTGGCIQAFTPLSFTITTKDNVTKLGETSQCKIDYDLNKSFEEMGYFVGKDSIFQYDHTETLSLPGPDAINAISPEIKNNGDYTLFIICQDANGNKNGKPFLIKFCVEKGPDLTPPKIVGTSIPSNSPINFNKTSLNLEVYVNEPANCKWSRQNVGYDNMENNMSCVTDVLKMNPLNTYTCKTTLTGIVAGNQKENDYYFRCKDQPGLNNSQRIVNNPSHYVVIGTQPLNIMSISPENEETIMGSTNYINVTLSVKTDNGYKNGEAICYYSLTGSEKDYIEFLDTNITNIHTQRQDLTTGDYKYYIKCVDLGGNTAYNTTSFKVETDLSSPTVVRAYKSGEMLKIITNEKADCSYSNLNCNFDLNQSQGTEMGVLNVNRTEHSADWSTNKNYFIRCKDKYDNQPNPNTCSIILRPIDLVSTVVEEM